MKIVMVDNQGSMINDKNDCYDYDSVVEWLNDKHYVDDKS